MQKRGHPPRSLLAAIVGITVIPLGFLLWLGWRFLDQDRVLGLQQAQDRLERSADLVIGAVQRNVAASEQRLTSGAADGPEGAVVLRFQAGRIEARPRSRVAFLPVVVPAREAPAEVFAEGEAYEFRRSDRSAAIRAFTELAGSRDPAVRAGALLRLARNLKGARPHWRKRCRRTNGRQSWTVWQPPARPRRSQLAMRVASCSTRPGGGRNCAPKRGSSPMTSTPLDGP